MSKVLGSVGTSPSPTDDEEAVAPSDDRFIAERGRMTWLTSEEDGGPDCGLILGLGEGYTLHVGEFANATVSETGIDLKDHPCSWWIALGTPDGFRFAGTVVDEYCAQEMIERVFASLRFAPEARATAPSPSVGGSANSELAKQASRATDPNTSEDH